MVTTQNYFDRVKQIKVSSLPAKLKEGYDFVKELTDNHSSWDYYRSDQDIKAAVDEYFANLSDWIKSHENKPSGKENSSHSNVQEEKLARQAAKKLIRTDVERGLSANDIRKSSAGSASPHAYVQVKGNKIHVDKLNGKKVAYSFPLQSIYNELLEELGTQHQAQRRKKTTPNKKSESDKLKPHHKQSIRISTRDAKPVERIDDEVRFIKRYIRMHGKVKTNTQVLHFINALQRAIVEKRIRKTSSYVKEIEYIQSNLVKLYNTMGKQVEIRIQDKVLDVLTTIAGSEAVRLSVNFMKRYIGVQGKHIDKEKAKKLYNLIAIALNKGKIKGADPHMDKINTVLASLKNFIESSKKDDTLHIHSAVLNGINQALDGCGCDSGCNHGDNKALNGIEQEPVADLNNKVMNSIDFSELEFDTLGFMGKWKELIGDPSEGFTAMVFGKPKMGKSYLCVDFAGYLARHHGKTLYVAKEEKLDATLQKKLNDKNVKHPSLDVSDHLPNDLSYYQFIFLDSVSKLGLSPQDLETLEAENKGKSFIYIFQTTKEGNFRGANQFQHNVDVVIEVPEKGKAIQFGRFNQGGEMEIFAEFENNARW
jgi:hypothetical protein